ncbi:glycosyltransferase [Algoriphagus aestuariicola]|uniref:Glycosyltransferase n=1 Tax=Algoriphagus aestuariicola TaxID=1852016 RepID=A0ABS3BUD7_9BACT|nr:glycosyltransferase [Algoriphagus aestuariicola]MBN7801945.1 glycosyltransferase [Algoriphagus aestuariicola]
MVKFSICIPAFKSTFLEECIQSILDQSLGDFELIILNDCSPQPVQEIVEKFTDDRIRYFSNEKNVGAYDLVDNWNKCLSLASGEFFLIMGDDDRLHPDYLLEFSTLIEKFPTLNVYHCRSKIIDDAGKTLRLTPALPAFEHVFDSIWQRLEQLRSNYISDYVYCTEALRQQGGFYKLPLAWGSDDITAFIASRELGIAHSNRPVFEYRSNAQSITSTGSDLVKMEANLAYADWLREFLKHEPADYTDRIAKEFLLEHFARLMEKRKAYTLLLSLAGNRLEKSGNWWKKRKEFGLSEKAIAVAFLKSFLNK